MNFVLPAAFFLGRKSHQKRRNTIRVRLMRSWLRLLPNLISCFRILLVPVTVAAVLQSDYWLGLILFIVAGISDAADGTIARLAKVQSTLGSYLDPLADKLLLVSVYGALSAQGLLPWEMTLLVLARDGMILGGYVWFHWRRGPFNIQPMLISKVNTFLQIILVVWILTLEVRLTLIFLPLTLAQNLTHMLEIGMIASTVISGLLYVRRWYWRFKGAKGSL